MTDQGREGRIIVALRITGKQIRVCGDGIPQVHRRPFQRRAAEVGMQYLLFGDWPTPLVRLNNIGMAYIALLTHLQNYVPTECVRPG
jgi:hypothetical protein